jgi:hypothetical protein
MIYTIYEKIIEITSSYKAFDYFTYLVFVLFILICSMSAVVYAKGSFSLTGSDLIYIISEPERSGYERLPPLDVSCDSDNNLFFSTDINISGYRPNDVLDLSITEGSSENSKHYLIRLPSDGNSQTFNYSQDLSSWSKMLKFSYNEQWNLGFYGEFTQGMVITLSNLKASSKAGACRLTWRIVSQ